MATQRDIPTAEAVIDLPVPPGTKASEYLNAYVGWVYSASILTATTFAANEIKLFKKRIIGTGDNASVEIDEVSEHPVLSLLEKVNDFMTLYQLKVGTSIYLDLLGEAAWALLRNGNGDILEIWPLRPDWIKVVPSRKDYVAGYVYAPGGGIKEVPLERENVIWFKDFNPKNPYRGFGKVQAAAMEIDIDDFSSEYNRNFFFNGAVPGLFLMTPDDINHDQIKRYANAFQQKFGGRRNSNKIAILKGNWKVDRISGDKKELDFKETQAAVRDKMLATFGVSKSNLGLVEDVNRANSEAQDRRFLGGVIKPRLTAFVGFLNEFLLPNYDNSESLFFNFEDPVPENTELNLQIYDNALKHGWMSRNEIREREGLEAVDGGDIIYIGANNVPIGSVGSEDVPEEAEEAVEEEQEERGLFGKWFKGKRRAIRLKARRPKKRFKFGAPIPHRRLEAFGVEKFKGEIKHDLVKLVAALMEKKEAPSGKEPKGNLDREAIWKQFVAVTEIQEEKLRKIIIQLAREQAQTVLDKLTERTKNLDFVRDKISASSFLFGKSAENKKWKDILMPVLAAIMGEKGNNELNDLGVEGEIDVEGAIKEFLEGRGTEFITQVNDTTTKQLIKELNEGIKAGEGFDELRDRVVNVYSKLEGYRARNIVRTAIIGSNNFASEEAYKQSGVVVGKEWLTAMDENVRLTHQAADGQVVPLGRSFDVGGSKLKFPGDPSGPPAEIVNCRCTTVPVTLSQVRDAKNREEKQQETKIEELAALVIKRLNEKKLVGQQERIKKNEVRLKAIAAASKVTEAATRLKANEIAKKAEKKARTDARNAANEEIALKRNDVESLNGAIRDKEGRLERLEAKEDVLRAKVDLMYSDAKKRARKLLKGAKRKREGVVADLAALRDKITKKLRDE